MRRSLLATLVCGMPLHAQADPAVLSVSTRLVEKAERSTPGARAVETQRSTTVVLAPSGDTDFAGELASQGREVALALAWDGKAPRARFGLDQDADGTLAEIEWREVAVRASQQAASPRVQFEVPPLVEVAGRPYGLTLRRHEDGVVRAEWMLDVDYRTGAVELDGEEHTLLVIDWDDDARFGSPGDVFTFLPTTRFLALPGLGAGRGFMFPAGDAALLGERRARLRGLAREDGTVEVALGPPAEPLGETLRRRRARAVASLTGQQVDPGAGIAWHWVLDADAALAVAKAEGRPLFLLFENEPDERCARMDVETWGDEAVAAATRAFTCARVTIELDVTNSRERFDVRLGPAYVFCSADGRPLHFRDRRTGQPVAMAKGFKAPAEMAAFLAACAQRLKDGAFDR